MYKKCFEEKSNIQTNLIILLHFLSYLISWIPAKSLSQSLLHIFQIDQSCNLMTINRSKNTTVIEILVKKGLFYKASDLLHNYCIGLNTTPSLENIDTTPSPNSSTFFKLALLRLGVDCKIKINTYKKSFPYFWGKLKVKIP